MENKKTYILNIRKIVFCVCCFWRLQAVCDATIITLGEACPVTGALEAVSLKKASHPFESNITSFQALYECLLDDFQEFTNPDFFTPYIDSRSPVNKYGIVLAHDFPIVSIGFDSIGIEKFILDPNWRVKLSQVQEKYNRRINRFRENCRSQKKIYFLRYLGIDKNQAEILSNLIHSQYPDLDYTLVCVLHANEEDWGISRVKNFYLNTSLDGRLEWKRICQELGLISP